MSTFKLAFGDTSELAKVVRDAIGVGPYDEVEVATPQFKRTDGRKVTYFPSSPNQFEHLKTLKPEVLKALCMAQWDEKGLWLFPGEWYEFIPEGFVVTDINYKTEPFKKGATDDDIRFGCLAYGIVPNPQPIFFP